MKSLIQKWMRTKLFFCRYFGRNYTAKVCGHKTKLVCEIDVFGKKIIVQFNRHSEMLYCPECTAKMSIKCAWCEKSIMIGDPITLYTPMKKDFEIPKHAVIYKKDPLQLVGCLRWDCADCGDRMGFWDYPGKVERVLSPIEIALMTGKTVIVGDLTDINETIPISDE